MRPVKSLFGSVETIRRDGFESVGDVSYDLYRVLTSSLSRLDDGDFRVYDREWDVLIVLDGCRPDLLAGVARYYDFLPGVRSVRSAGSTSEEWLTRSFAPAYADEMAHTAYVTGNPFSESYLDAADFATLDEVWRYAWDEDIGTIRASPLTETARYRWHADQPERMIVHYMQPHFPSVPRPKYQSAVGLDRGRSDWSSVWDQLRKGRVDREQVWRAYRANLEYVLKSVEDLVTGIDAEQIVVTADHGNSFGSWGLYGHPAAPIDAIRRVPWCECTARDVSGVDPEPPPWISTGDRAVDTGVEKSSRLALR